MQQSGADQAIDQWRVCLNACGDKAKRKHFEHMLMMCSSSAVSNLLQNLNLVFCFTAVNQSWFLKF